MSPARLPALPAGIAVVVALLVSACADPEAPPRQAVPTSTTPAVPDTSGDEGRDHVFGGAATSLADGTHHGVGRAVDVESRRFIFQPDGADEAVTLAVDTETTYVVYVGGGSGGGGHITDTDLDTFARVVNASPDLSWTVSVRAKRVVSIEQDSDISAG